MGIDNVAIPMYNVNVRARETKEAATMTYSDISYYAAPNSTDAKAVASIADSMLSNGWTGAPILVHAAHGILLTGSHRLAALKVIDASDAAMDASVLSADIAEDVSDIIDAYCEANDESIDELELDNLSKYFAGTWVERYAAEHAEW